MRKPKIVSVSRIEFEEDKAYLIEKLKFFLDNVPNHDWYKIDEQFIWITKDKTFEIVEYG